MLDETKIPLCRAHDTTVLDLDGVVYIGAEAIPGAAAHLTDAQAAGTHLAYVTNNASKTPEDVVEKLRSLGMPVAPGDVVTSAQAAARVLAQDLPPGSSVYLIGGEGLHRALTEEGLRAVTTAEEGPVAVAQGFGPDMPWSRVVLGASLVKEGLPWVATNTDSTFPTARGIGPGNGTLVRLVADFAGREPRVAGKPSPPLLEETLRRVGGSRPLMVGDRLDTDIAGAVEVGWPSLLVLTGVTGLEDLVAAAPHERPTYISRDLGGLLAEHPVPQPSGGEGDAGHRCGGWEARVRSGALEITGDGEVDDWWRAVAATAWTHLDRHGKVLDTSSVTPQECVGG